MTRGGIHGFARIQGLDRHDCAAIPAELVADIDDLVGVDGRQEVARVAFAERSLRTESFHDAIDRLQGKMIPEWGTPESTA